MGICPCVKSQDRDIEEDPEKALVQKKRTVDIKEPDPGTSSFSNQIKQRAQTRVEDVYEIMNPPIGQGQLGEVRKARHKQTNEMFAIRVIKKISQKEKDKLFLELQLIKSLDHPNICKVIEYYHQDGIIYIVNELLNGDKLFVKVIEQEKGFTEKDAAHYIHQVLSVVAFCHSKNIVHRDINADNLIFRTNEQDSILKIIDFGASRYYEPGEIMQQKGISVSNVHYKSPQVIEGVYDQSCDVWSCGILLYIMLYGMPPFYDASNDKKKIIKNIQQNELEFLDDVEISESAKELLKAMLEKNPQERITAQDALKHDWIKKREQMQVDGQDLSKSIQNLKSFRANQGIQQAIWGVIVTQLSSQDEKEKLGKLFRSLDTDNSGTLSKQEMMDGFLKQMTKQQADELVNRIFSTIDPNQNGEVDYTEFLRATINRENALSVKKLEMAFNMFDTDASGKISVEEMMSFFNASQGENSEKWIQLIKEADENGDGEIDFNEFKNLMLKMLEEEREN